MATKLKPCHCFILFLIIFNLVLIPTIEAGRHENTKGSVEDKEHNHEKTIHTSVKDSLDEGDEVEGYN
ncbi:hypothetical protein JCGZ_09632 [Jatropha curcas]|uniref:Transmembrane protein n=1 Tax=Jatropha curcas TaxID=180498 RepID=A0A067LDS2_JATCU|nr:hypothetical protein JCGZ_09632 [Jatropha curcas]